MGDGAQVFKGVALLLQRIVAGAGADEGDLAGLDLKGLLGARGQHERARHADGAAHAQAHDLGVVLQRVGLRDDLQVLEERAVVELDERERLGIAQRADPSGYAHVWQILRGRLAEDFAHGQVGHGFSILLSRLERCIFYYTILRMKSNGHFSSAGHFEKIRSKAKKMVALSANL